MDEREKDHLFQKLMDAEIELPSDLEDTLGKTRFQNIRMDRILNEKLARTVCYNAKPHLSDAQFKTKLLSALENAERAEKPSLDLTRRVLVYLREKLLYSETASMQWSGVAALILVVVSIPFIVTNDSQFLNQEKKIMERSSDLPVVRDPIVSLDSKNKVESNAASGAAPGESFNRGRSRSYNLEISKEDVIAEERENFKDVKKEAAPIPASREESLLENLRQAKTEQEKLQYLKELENLYISTGQLAKLKSTREKIKATRSHFP